jgi:hypothetical protein
MSLTRIWTPTGSYGSGGTKRLIVIHTMEGFTGPYGAKDCMVYFQGDVGASSQVGIDNNRGTIWEGVSRHNASYTQCNYNGQAVSCEQSGYASWSRSYWLNERDNQLRNIAEWIAEESRALGIPIKRLTASQAQGGGWGICGHEDLGGGGCGHADPGANWPWDYVLDLALGGGAPAQPEQQWEEFDMASVDPDGTALGMPFTAKGEYSAVNLGGDPAGDPGWAEYRVAHRIGGTDDWRVTMVRCTRSSPRQVVEFKEDIDLVSIAWTGGVRLRCVPAYKRRA